MKHSRWNTFLRVSFFSVTLLISGLGSELWGADGADSFKKNIIPFSHTQQLAEIILDDSSVTFAKDGRIACKELWNFHEIAKQSRINTTRLDAFNYFINLIGHQEVNKFQQWDKFIGDLQEKCLEPCFEKNDFLFPVAICVLSRKFLNSVAMSSVNEEVKSSCFEIQVELEDEVKDKIRDRFADDTLKMLVEAYRKDFPNSHLLFDQVKPSDFSSCVALAQKSLSDFHGLDNFSAAAQFSEWGRCMLNVLLLCNEPMLEDEFKRQLKLYHSTFKKNAEAAAK